MYPDAADKVDLGKGLDFQNRLFSCLTYPGLFLAVGFLPDQAPPGARLF